MNDEELFAQMNSLCNQTETEEAKPTIVIAEFELSSTDLHNIANGKCMILNDKDTSFKVQFLLKDSFKSGKSNFVINKFAVQIVVSEKRPFMKKEEIAVKTKVEKRTSVEKKVESKPETKLEIEDSNESLF